MESILNCFPLHILKAYIVKFDIDFYFQVEKKYKQKWVHTMVKTTFLKSHYDLPEANELMGTHNDTCAMGHKQVIIYSISHKICIHGFSA